MAVDDPAERSTEFRPALRLDEDAAFHVLVVRGSDVGATFMLDGRTTGRVLVGQSPICDLRLSDPAVSRRHAALELCAGRIRYRDLESTNGSFVDELSVVEAWLVGGETVRIGGTELRVERAAATAGPSIAAARTRFGGVVGGSAEMRHLYPLCERLARADVPVVIEGETGTGKEVLAEALHLEGSRANAAFVVFDCTAVAPSLVEAELFGHERGAFTGAVGQRKGVFEQAHGGTLLIDEIGDLDLALQPKLLRAIERREVRRIGGDRAIAVDVRVLAATRRDLDREVAEGRFRDDLFHRLAVARVELPPLRRRRGDVGLLGRHFLEQLGADPTSVGREQWQRWDADPWPGNVRELRNAIARHVALGELAEADGGRAGGAASGDLDDYVAMDLPFAAARERVMAEFERRYIARVLEKHGGNVGLAAKSSGIGRRYFQMVRARSR